MKSNYSGYTLIEVMVSTLIILGIVGGGIASYSSFNTKQTLVNVGRELAVEMRSFQKSAQSGEKPEDSPECQLPARLDGWEIYTKTSQATEYFSRARCNGLVASGTEKTYYLPKGVYFSNNPFSIEFEVLTGKASNSETVTVTNGNQTYSIQVTLAGGIKEE